MANETRITKAVQDLRRALTASLADTQAVLARDAEAAKARIEKRKTLARSLQLSERLLEIYEEVKYYPSWLHNAPDSVCPLVTDVEAPTELHDKLQVRFTFRENRYTFDFNGHWTTCPDGEGAYYADLSLLDPANEVLYTVWLGRGEYPLDQLPSGEKPAIVLSRSKPSSPVYGLPNLWNFLSTSRRSSRSVH